MRLILHPGWSKTGTSALQKYFATNYDQLKVAGVLYPQAGRYIDDAHHGLALAAQPRTGIEFSGDLQPIVDEIMAEAKSASATTVVLSSELSPIYFELPSFEGMLDAFENFDVIFTVRPQSEILVSLYKQLLKDASLDFRSSVMDMFLEHSRWLDFATTIEQWEAASDVYRPTFHVVTYTPNNLVKDFLLAAGLPFFDDDERSNQSPSDLGTAVLAKTVDFRNSLVDLEQRENFVAHVLGKTEGVDIEGYPLSSADATFVDRVYDHSNSRVAKKFFDREYLFENTARDEEHPALRGGMFNALVELIVQDFQARS